MGGGHAAGPKTPAEAYTATRHHFPHRVAVDKKQGECVRFYWDFESFRVAENRVAIYIVDTSGPKSEFGSMTQDTNYLKVLSAVNSASRSIYTVHLQRYARI